MKEFAYIWAGEPIDFWENAIVTSIEEYDRVMAQMPEEARAEVVLKTYMPTDGDCLRSTCARPTTTAQSTISVILISSVSTRKHGR